MLVGRTVFAGLQAGFRCRLTGVKNMKVVILAGGYGTRISEESKFKPKPMIEIGGMPILWHIMKEYSYYGFNDFVICAGCNLVRRTEKGRLRRRGWGLRWEKAQKGGKGTNLRGFFED